MMTQNADKKREQIQLFCMDDMVPQDHLLRIIDKAIDWSFIYELVEEKYSQDNGRPSMDPVMLIKIPFIQYLYGIKSMRQTVKEIEVNVAYRWFLGLDMLDKVPHFSTFGKNYTRRFKDTDLFEQIFEHILSECYKFKLVDPTEVFVDATHVKARANNKKMQKRIAHDEALFFEDLLKQEINEDREAHGKRPLKEKEDDSNTPSGGPDGELGASLRYLSQRYSMPYPELKGLLTDIGVEELGHLEMIGAMVHQLTRNLTEKQIEENPGFAAYFVDHTAGVYPTSASGSPWNAASIGVKGDTIADLNEDLAADGAIV